MNDRCFWCLSEDIYLTLEQKNTKKVRSACKNHANWLIFWSIWPIFASKWPKLVKKYEFLEPIEQKKLCQEMII